MATDDADFARVLASAAAGDAAAWEQLVAADGALVSAYVHAVSADDPDGEVVRIFADAARGIDCFDGDRLEFRAYLFDIAVAHRRSGATTAGRPAESGAVGELALLHPDVRDAVLLARIGELGPPAIADILEVPTSTILDWQRQGLEFLDR